MCHDYRYHPTIIPSVRRIIVIGDIHGDYALAIKLLRIAGVMDKQHNWIGGDTHVVQVGDQIDRCRPSSGLSCNHPRTTVNDEASDVKILHLFNKLDRQSQKHKGRVISLLGNHEIMNSLGVMKYVSYQGIKEFENYSDPRNPSLQFDDGLDARRYAFSPGNQYGTMLGCSRLAAVIIGSNLFVHGGIIDSIIEYLELGHITDLEKINLAVQQWLLGLINQEYVDKIIQSSNQSMFWNRILGQIPPNTHHTDPICSDNIGRVLKLFKVGTVIVGHTPQITQFGIGINGTCLNDNRAGVWRVDNAVSGAFDGFFNLVNSEKYHQARTPQVLEIINDVDFRIIR